MNEVSNDGISNVKEQSRCFVCDAEVLGRSYALATCRTQNSRTRVIEKLGELVGEGYMLVISENDVICRSCGILVSTLDRLETEMQKARDHILHFLEQKYSLKDRELRGNGDKPKPCQPPQIMKSGAKESPACSVNLPNESDLNPGDKNIPTKSHSWLQCDKCKYATHFNSFMIYHMRSHAKEKIFYDNCELDSSESQQDKRHSCSDANNLGNKENETDNSGITKNDATKVTFVTQIKSILPITQITPPPLIGLSNSDHLYISNTLPTSDSTSSQQPVYVLQSMVDIDNSRKTTRSDTNLGETEVKDRAKKQMLTLKEDGSLEMMEIMAWNETEAPNIDPTIAFE